MDNQHSHLCRLGGVAAALLLSVMAAGCADTDPTFEEARTLLVDPVGIGDRLMVVEHATATAFLLDAEDPEVAPLEVPLLREPILAAPRAGHPDEALVLSAGVAGDSDAVQAPGGLSLVDSEGGVRAFPLGNNPFQFIVQQPKGRHVALLRRGGSEQLLQNVNEMAIVDLEAPEGEGARLLTLPEAPRTVFFSDAFEVQDMPLDLAVVLTENTAAVFDLGRPDARPVLIQLNTDLNHPLQPQEVRFDAANGRMYLRSAGADDIFSLRLVGREPAEGQVDFGISLDIVAAGREPTDMQLFELDGATYLLVVAEGSREVVLVDVATSRAVSVRVPVAFDHARIYYTGDEDAGSRSPHALLWDTRGGALATLSLALSSTALDRSLELLPPLPSGVREVVTFSDGTVVFVGNSQHITLVDPGNTSVTPYSARRRISSGLLDEQRALLWLAPDRQRRVAYLDLETGGTGDMLLDTDVFSAVLVPGANRLAIVHDNGLGHVTLIDLDDPSRGSSRSIRGFLAHDLFE